MNKFFCTLFNLLFITCVSASSSAQLDEQLRPFVLFESKSLDQVKLRLTEFECFHYKELIPGDVSFFVTPESNTDLNAVTVTSDEN